MTVHRFTLLTILVLAGSLSTGCRNPFDPAAQVDIVRFFAQGTFCGSGGFVAQITQTPLDPPSTSVDQKQRVCVMLRNTSSVNVLFTSYTVVYRQLGRQGLWPSCTLSPTCRPPDSPIAALGDAAGRRYTFVLHMQGVRFAGTPTQTTLQVPVRIITEELLEYIEDAPPVDIQSGGLDCDITLHGEDHNGHDVKVSGTLHIEVF